jgi:hypothetical protein
MWYCVFALPVCPKDRYCSLDKCNHILAAEQRILVDMVGQEFLLEK